MLIKWQETNWGGWWVYFNHNIIINLLNYYLGMVAISTKRSLQFKMYFTELVKKTYLFLTLGIRIFYDLCMKS